MSDYLDRPVYDDVADEARADWLRERPDDDRPTRAEIEADERGVPSYDESRLCVRCENGHGGHVCAWCSGAAS